LVPYEISISIMNDIISTKLFETEDVSVFRIPPGEISLSKWDLNDSNTIWKGSLRLTEEELIQEDNRVFYTGPSGVESEFSSFTVGDKPSAFFQKDSEAAPIKPYKGLRLKLELFNFNNSLVVPPNESRMEDEKIWGEVWYNPLPAEEDNSEVDFTQYCIANNREETIQMTPQSVKFYKIIVQLPGSGYHPFIQEEEQVEDGYLLQVALGLKISENFAAISFSESLNIYRRRFKNFVDQYNYELRLSEVESRQKLLTINNDDPPNDSSINKDFENQNLGNFTDDDDDDNDDDDFGDFVGG